MSTDDKGPDGSQRISERSRHLAPAGKATDLLPSTYAPDDDNAVAGARLVAGGKLDEPPGDYNSRFGVSLGISSPSEARSRNIVQIIALPTNGVVVRSDGRTPVTVGESLIPSQAAGLRFKFSGVPVSSQLNYDVILPGGSLTHWSISLPFDPTTGTVTPAAPVDPPFDPASTDATSLAAAASATATPVADNSAATNISQPANAADAASTNAAPAGIGQPADYNSVFGTSLNISVASEAPSPETFQITTLPTNGSVVLSDGLTPVTTGRTLTPAQAAGLRFKAHGAGASASQLALNQIGPGHANIGRTISISVAQNGKVTHQERAPSAQSDSTSNAALAVPATLAATTANTATAPSNPNPVLLENEKPGTPQSVWQVAPGGDSTQIQGFTTNISTPLGAPFSLRSITRPATEPIRSRSIGWAITVATALPWSPRLTTREVLSSSRTRSPTQRQASSMPGIGVSPFLGGPLHRHIRRLRGRTSSMVPRSSKYLSSSATPVRPARSSFKRRTRRGRPITVGAETTSTGATVRPPVHPGAAFAVSYNRPIVTRDSIGTFAGSAGLPIRCGIFRYLLA